MRIITLALVAAIFSLAIQHNAQAVEWPKVGKACLPETDRMLPVYDWEANSDVTPIPPCHCPPKELCPVTQAEWDAAEKMPPYIAEACCAKTEEIKSEDCTLEYVAMPGTGCPGYYTTGNRPITFCGRYEAVAATDKTVADTLNSCLGACMANEPDEKQVIAYDREGTKKLKKAKKSKKNQMIFEGEGGLVNTGFISCELKCRKTAATSLGIDPNTLPELDLDSGTLVMYANDKTFSVPGVPQAFADFVAAAYEGDESEYVKSLPAAEQPVGSGLEAKLQCQEDKKGNICYSAVLNDGSCESCLNAGTPVLMADGSTKPIESIAVGDMVKGRDQDNKVLELVIRKWPTLVMYKINGDALQLTADHPVLTTLGWRAVDYNADLMTSLHKYKLQNVPKLKVGDVLVTANGEITVESITPTQSLANATTYNLRLEGDGAFFANGIAVKDNSGEPDAAIKE